MLQLLPSLTLLFFVQSGTSLLLTPYVQDGRLAEARSLSQVTVDAKEYGYAGYLSVPSQHQPAERINHIYFWYQPCTECTNASTAPLLVWLQGGPGGPGTFGAMTEIGNF